MQSLSSLHAFLPRDNVVQMARCTFDVHVQEIIGTLAIGATIVMLHPGGLLDFDYLSNVLYNKQVTYILSVPSLFQSFFTFLAQYPKHNAVQYLRSICSGG